MDIFGILDRDEKFMQIRNTVPNSDQNEGYKGYASDMIQRF